MSRFDKSTGAGQLPASIQNRLMDGDPYWSWLPIGWHDIVVKLDEELNEVAPYYVLDQCKEKFGQLRYSIELPTYGDGSGNQKAWDLIAKYEQISVQTCDVCGKSGTGRNIESWLATRCDKHNVLANKLKELE